MRVFITSSGLQSVVVRAPELVFGTCTAFGCSVVQNATQCSEAAAVLGWTVSTVNEMLDRYQSMTATQSNSAIRKLEARA